MQRRTAGIAEFSLIFDLCLLAFAVYVVFYFYSQVVTRDVRVDFVKLVSDYVCLLEPPAPNLQPPTSDFPTCTPTPASNLRPPPSTLSPDIYGASHRAVFVRNVRTRSIGGGLE